MKFLKGGLLRKLKIQSHILWVNTVIVMDNGLFEGKPNWPERMTSSGFITWGWDEGYKNNIKDLILKTIQKKFKR